MQTFVPSADPYEIARMLDTKRLGKQILECVQILEALHRRARNEPGPWTAHPATLMWEGHRAALAAYGLAMCDEWQIGRGFDSHTGSRAVFEKVIAEEGGGVTWPEWWGYNPMIISHQSNLVRKNPEHYRPFFPDVPDDLEYFWPTKSVEFAD